MSAVANLSHLVAWLGVSAMTVWSWSAAPPVRQPDWNGLGVSLIKGREYLAASPRRATMDIYRLAAKSDLTASRQARPAVLLLHGGSWIGGLAAASRTDPAELVVRLARQGLVVFAVDYRLARPGAPSWPAIVGDLRKPFDGCVGMATNLESILAGSSYWGSRPVPSRGPSRNSSGGTRPRRHFIAGAGRRELLWCLGSC